MIRVTSPLRSAAVSVLLAATALVQAADSNPTQERADRFLLLVNSAYKSLITIEGIIHEAMLSPLELPASH